MCAATNRCEFWNFYSRQMLNSRLRIVCLTLICPFVLLPQLIHADYGHAADCSSKACIDVYVHDGQLVIEAHKGSGPKSRAVPKITRKAAPRKYIAPSPKPSAKLSAAVQKSAPRPRRAPRKVVKKKVVPALSFNDKLIRLLPTGNIAHQPSTNALVNVPVIYWCDLPAIFTSKVAIVGEAVDVTMRPSFLWSFGDGTFYSTTTPGSPYPRQVISHTYSRAGTYVVTLVATWGGTWSNNGVARAITGEIRKVSVSLVSVANAPTRITQ